MHTLADMSLWGSTPSGNSVATTLAWTQSVQSGPTLVQPVCELTPVIKAEPPLSCSPISREFHLSDLMALWVWCRSGELKRCVGLALHSDSHHLLFLDFPLSSDAFQNVLRSEERVPVPSLQHTVPGLG